MKRTNRPKKTDSKSHWMLDLWKREWAVIKGAPISFVTCLGIAIGLSVSIAFWYSERQTAATISAKNATIEAKEAFIQRLSASKDTGGVYTDLPTTDPHVKGKPWSNGGVLCISDGK